VDNKQAKRLLLQAEMELPGEAWLEFRIDNENVLHLTATFRPHGLAGRLYWYSIMPFHALLFIFYGSHGITHSLLFFIGIRELKVRQIDHNIISGWWFFPIMAISSVIIYFLWVRCNYSFLAYFHRYSWAKGSPDWL
jgi:hypothetical protein